ECLTYINLGLIYHYQGQHDLAIAASESALTVAEGMDSNRLQGIAWQTLGTSRLAHNHYQKASNAYWQALAIWMELNNAIFSVEARTGLVRTALLQNDLSTIQAHLPPILETLATDETLDGAESPFQVYLTSYQALKVLKDGRAFAILEQGHQILQQRAAEITNEKARNEFFAVAVHKELTAVYQDEKRVLN
ncbi:MAG: tetratricopeptide repeat protein, partial [Chloroflexi bacterium]|nr:tetratricopeptide repeat protein [Chloroflexota bacterium]